MRGHNPGGTPRAELVSHLHPTGTWGQVELSEKGRDPDGTPENHCGITADL